MGGVTLIPSLLHGVTGHKPPHLPTMGYSYPWALLDWITAGSVNLAWDLELVHTLYRDVKLGIDRECIEVEPIVSRINRLSLVANFQGEVIVLCATSLALQQLP
jgi:hypothetical protein